MCPYGWFSSQILNLWKETQLRLVEHCMHRRQFRTTDCCVETDQNFRSILNSKLQAYTGLATLNSYVGYRRLCVYGFMYMHRCTKNMCVLYTS